MDGKDQAGFNPHSGEDPISAQHGVGGFPLDAVSAVFKGFPDSSGADSESAAPPDDDVALDDAPSDLADDTADRLRCPPDSADTPSPATEPSLAYLAGRDAACMVREIQSAQQAEAAARGRLLRVTAHLYAHALERRGLLADSIALALVPWAVDASTKAHVASSLAQHSKDLVFRDVAAEIGVALMLPTGTARAVVEHALVLTGDLPETLEFLEAGRITWQQAQVILDSWRAMVDHAPTDARAEAIITAAMTAQGEIPIPVAPGVLETAARNITRELLNRAPNNTSTQLRAFARRRRASVGAAAHQRACSAARRHRDVWITAEDDGLATLHAILDAPTATAAQSRLHKMVDSLESDHRLVGEKRADVLGDLLLDGELPQTSGIPHGIRGQVTITVAASDLVAHDPHVAGALVVQGGHSCPDERESQGISGGTGSQGDCSGQASQDGSGVRPAQVVVTAASTDAVTAGQSGAHLQGYGPISTLDALRIAAAAPSWKRILTDPDTGVVTQYGRSTYSVPTGLRQLLAARDQTCRFPGCRRQASTCDIDHTLAWEHGGGTDAVNLAHLCRHHHSIKHDDGALGTWSVRQVEPTEPDPPPGSPGTSLSAGILEWTSPTGIVRRTLPGSCSQPLDPPEDPPPF